LAENVRWRRDIPPRRSDFSIVTFSRQFQGPWIDCLVIEAPHLSVYSTRGNDKVLMFITTTAASHVRVEVTPRLTGETGITSKNLGLVISERVGGIVNELPTGKLALKY